jgi:PAS domain S-box-containing protein
MSQASGRTSRRSPLPAGLAWPLALLAPAAALLVAVGVLESAGVRGVREWTTVVVVFNALFCAAPALVIAFVAARDYLATGSVVLLLFGPASLVLGLGYLLSGLLITNLGLSLSVFDIGVLAASVLLAASGLSALTTGERAGPPVDRTARLVFAYLGTLGLVGIIVALAALGVIPEFYSATGETMSPQLVLTLAVALLFVAAACLLYLYTRAADRFLLMCGAACALIGASLAALVFTRALSGSAISWVGRSGQWIGGIYLLIAVLTLTQRRILPLRDFRELQERYRTLVELSPDPIVVDADGRYLFANPAAARLLGIPSPDALIGRRIEEFVSPEYVAEIGRRRDLAMTGRPARPQEIRLIRADGSTVDVETMDRRVTLGGRMAALVIMRDITQRKLAEEALRRSEESYRLLAEENEQLYRQQLEIADSLQTAFLNLPSSVGRLRLGHGYHSATEAARVGGDFYDVFEIKDDLIAVLIGDVAGHGILAARTATLVKDVVHAFTHQSPRSREVMRRTNKVLVEKEVPGFFVTVFLAILDARTGEFQYTSAGHPAALLRRASGDVETLQAGSLPLGIYPDISWSTAVARLEPGDVLLLYTDGVVEARWEGEFFGEERLKRLLGGDGSTVEELPGRVLERVLSFSHGVLSDDVAILALSLSEEGDAVGAVGQDRDRNGVVPPPGFLDEEADVCDGLQARGGEVGGGEA